MRAINHALTGTVIGLSVANPMAAVLLSFVSHYVCDVLPHFGVPNNEAWLRKRSFKVVLLADTLLCLAVVVVLAATKPRHWLLAAICAFVAASPDLASIPRFNFAQKTAKEYKATNWYFKFAFNIQWFERPIGAVVEVAWAVAMVSIIAAYL